MLDGNNNLFDSVVASNVANNIHTEGTGCHTLIGVTSTGAAGAIFGGRGLDVSVAGTTNIIDSTFAGNSEDGINASVGNDNSLCLSLDGVTSMGNNGQGLETGDGVTALDVKDSRFLGNANEGIQVNFFDNIIAVLVADSTYDMNRGQGVSSRL